jgi:tetratricopeptide (TPR) repeat protein
MPRLRPALPLLALLALACQKEAPTPKNVPSPSGPVTTSKARQEAPAPAAPREVPAPATDPAEDPATTEQDPAPSDDLLMTNLEGDLPGSVDAIVARTVAHVRGGDPAGGLALLDRALKAKPKETRLLLLRGRYRLQRQQCEKALWDFESAARFDPRNATAHASVGLARLCIGDGEDAAQAFRRSLEIDPDQPEIRRALAGIAGP